MAGGNFFDFHARVVRGGRGQSEPAPPAAGQMPDALTVTQLTSRISGVLRSGFPSAVWVKGEVTNYKGPHSSGHHYFSLKDEQSLIQCVIWASEASRIRFKWTDGMEVLAQATVAIYGARSTYQLKISQLLPVGQGALELAFRQLKEKLEREGLFAAERKTDLPRFPRRVALVTSRGAAGLHDMLKVFQRFPWIQLKLFHVPVQGASAHPLIAGAIRALNVHAGTLGGVDLIVLARGGGSLEDLWAFNEEAVARAITGSGIPVVTGIGHEVDVSIADLVADYHAHTPTEAAQIVTQHWRQAGELLRQADERLRLRTFELHRAGSERLSWIARHDLFRRPVDTIIRTRQQRLDDQQKSLDLAVGQRLSRAARRIADFDARLQRHRPTEVLNALRKRLDHLATRLAERHPRHRVGLLSARLIDFQSRLDRAVRLEVSSRRLRLDALTRQLDAIGPLQVLQRGYSITMRKKDRQIIRSVKEIRPGDRMITRLADGEFEWVAGDGQMGLFGV